ncbi:hypothetical protein ACNS7O_00470 [Haloferacaceae archaeon DSL9]
MTAGSRTDAAASGSPSRFAERIERLAAESEAARLRFEPPAEPPDDDRALEQLTEGLAPVVSVYIEARTASPPVALSRGEFDRLQRAANGWLERYAACYGAAIDPEVAVRAAAELVVQTHDLRDTAQLLTGVPSR